MGCGCNREPKPKCTPRVLEIEKPEEKILFRKVVLPASAGDDGTNPPTPGRYKNVLLEYEANGHLYLYSSDGIATQIQAVNNDFNLLENRPLYDGEEMTGETSIPNVQTTVDDAVSAEASARDDADDDLQDQIDDLSGDLGTETTNRENADINLQSQIDAVVASSDVKDVVGTKAALDAYDTASLGDNDIIKVLQDETQNDATTYYRWSTTTSSFSLIGEEGPYYTKSASDIIFNTKADKSTTYTKTETNTLLNAKANQATTYTKTETDSLLATKQGTLTAGTNIQISNNTISATGTTYTAGSGLTLTNTAFSVDTETIATKNYVDTSLAGYTPTASLSAVATTGSYSDITNKPTIGNGTLTVTMNGATAGTFSANDTGDTTIALTSPTVVQATGTSTADVMSQKAVTDAISDIFPIQTSDLEDALITVDKVKNSSFMVAKPLFTRGLSDNETVTVSLPQNLHTFYLFVNSHINHNELVFITAYSNVLRATPILEAGGSVNTTFSYDGATSVLTINTADNCRGQLYHIAMSFAE